MMTGLDYTDSHEQTTWLGNEVVRLQRELRSRDTSIKLLLRSSKDQMELQEAKSAALEARLMWNAGQVDLMQPVVDAAREWREAAEASEDDGKDERSRAAGSALFKAVDALDKGTKV